MKHGKATALTVCSSVAGVILLVRLHINPASQTWVRTVAGITWPLLVLVAYFLFYLIRAPWKMHQEGVAAIERLQSMVPAYAECHLTLQRARVDPTTINLIPRLPGEQVEIILTNSGSQTILLLAPLWESVDVQPWAGFNPKVQVESTEPGGGWNVGAWHQQYDSAYVPPGVTFRAIVRLMPPTGEGLHRRLSAANGSTGTVLFAVQMNGLILKIAVKI